MVNYSDIRFVHVELTTNCNARCTQCSRNVNGYPYNMGYPEVDLNLNDFKKIFAEELVSCVEAFHFCGNFGDFAIARDSLDIVKYLRQVNPDLKIHAHTNGSLRPVRFWENLAEQNVLVGFGLDGIDNKTHGYYRKDTSYDKIIENAQAFISAGGQATWRMIKFAYNSEFIDKCQQIAKDMGFADFELVDYGRNQGPVYNRQGVFEYQLTTPTSICAGPTWQQTLANKLQLAESESGYTERESEKVKCWAEDMKAIYVDAIGNVYPCCFLGFYPETFPLLGNTQLQKLMQGRKVNALQYPLKECVEWFAAIEDSWTQPSYAQGKLITCVSQCGKCN